MVTGPSESIRIIKPNTTLNIQPGAVKTICGAKSRIQT